MPAQKWGNSASQASVAKGNKKKQARAKAAAKGKAGGGKNKGSVNALGASMKDKPQRARGSRASGGAGSAGKLLHRAYDPTHPVIPPSLYSHHGVFMINGTARIDLTAIINKVHMLICSAIPGFGTIGAHIVWDKGTSTSLASTAFFTVPQLKDAANSGGPSSSRVTKVGMRLVNAAPKLYQQGKVYVTKITQRLRLPAAPSAMQSTAWNAYIATLRGMPEQYTKPYNWADFAGSGKMEDKPIYCRVVDVPKYNDFSIHQGTETSLDAFLDNLAVWPGSTETSHPMSLCIVTWDAPDVADRLPDITCSMDAQFMTRWPIDSVPGISQHDVPASDPKIVKLAENAPTL